MAFLLVTLTFMISEINIVTRKIKLLISKMNIVTSSISIADIKNRRFN